MCKYVQSTCLVCSPISAQSIVLYTVCVPECLCVYVCVYLCVL